MIECCFDGVLRVFKGCFKEVQSCFKEVFSVFHGSFMDFERKFQGCFKGLSREIERCVSVKDTSRVLQGYFKEVQRVF